MVKTPSGLVQRATRRATASAWSLDPACLQACHSIWSHGKVTAVWDTGKKKKSFAQTSWRPPRRAKVTQRLLSKVTVPLGRSRGSRVLFWPPGSRRGKEGSFLGCQLLPAGALLLASRLLPRSFSTFMVLNLPFFLPSDSTSL